MKEWKKYIKINLNINYCNTTIIGTQINHLFTPWTDKSVLVPLHKGDKRSDFSGCDFIISPSKDKSINTVQRAVRKSRKHGGLKGRKQKTNKHFNYGYKTQLGNH